MSARRAGAGLFGLALATAFFATHGFDLGQRQLVRRHAFAYSGDEPHYLIVLHSLLFDGDLRIGNEYAAAAGGGPESGSQRAGQVLDHHSFFVDPASGATALWQDHFDYTAPVACDDPGCVPFRPSRPLPFPVTARTAEVPAHPPAFPALLAAALGPFAVAPERVEAGVAVALYAISTAGVLATFALGAAAGLGAGGSLAAASLLALASPWLPYARAIFPETVAGVALTAALLCMLRGRTVSAGAAIAAAAVFKPAIAVVGVAWVAERWLSGDRPGAARLFAPLAAVGIALLAFNKAALGPALVIGSSGSRRGNPLAGAFMTLFSTRLGVAMFAPWVILAAPALFRRGGANEPPRLGRLVAFALALYLPLISIPLGLGADCYGPRYWVSFMPCLAVLAVDTALRGGRRLRGLALTLAIAGAVIAIPGALLYADVWNAPPLTALSKLVGW